MQASSFAAQGSEEGIKDIIKQWEELAYHEEMPTPTEIQETKGRQSLMGGF